MMMINKNNKKLLPKKGAYTKNRKLFFTEVAKFSYEYVTDEALQKDIYLTKEQFEIFVNYIIRTYDDLESIDTFCPGAYSDGVFLAILNKLEDNFTTEDIHRLLNKLDLNDVYKAFEGDYSKDEEEQ